MKFLNALLSKGKKGISVRRERTIMFPKLLPIPTTFNESKYNGKKPRYKTEKNCPRKL